jgi:23S rRNA (uracil1939-C5)-methyltransferase
MKLQIEKCIYGGAGLARVEGKAIFVPFTLPGETIEAHIVEDKRSFANAELDAVIEASRQRAKPPCQYFGECGGCQYQHATYSEQIALKRSILQETLERARLASLPEIVPVYAEPVGYRNRVRLHLQRQPFALCYKRRASHANLPVSHCPIAAPILEQAIDAVTRIGQEFDLAEDFEEIEFFTNEAQSELLVSLWARRQVNGLQHKLARFCEALHTEIVALTGAAVFFAEKATPSDKKVAEWGTQALTYHAAGYSYRVSIGAFFQVNRFLVDRLVELVVANLSGELAWDLYAGAGLFARALSGRFEEIVAVEAATYSTQDLRENATTCKPVQSGTLDFLRQRSRHQEATSPDLVVVDPPRSGLGSDVTSILTKVRPQTIVYVSCDPATLSRDLHALVESGYQLRTMHMVDLFPQTFHLESVTVLSLR